MGSWSEKIKGCEFCFKSESGGTKFKIFYIVLNNGYTIIVKEQDEDTDVVGILKKSEDGILRDVFEREE